jgi:hypothetical protein
MWGGPWGGPVQPRSTLPAIRVQDGRPVRGPMQQAAGRARTIGTAQVAEEGRGQPARGSNDRGLWAMVVATELTMLEGGGQTETGACGAPQVRAHLRVAQASGTAELGSRAEASGTTGGPLRQRNGDPKRWPVYGTGDLKVVMASKIHFTFLRLATDIKPCLSRLWSP